MKNRSPFCKAESASEHAREDLSLVARTFQGLLSHLGYAVEFYYASSADPERTQIQIERVIA